MINRDKPLLTDHAVEQIRSMGEGLDKEIFVVECGSSRQGQSQYKTHWFWDPFYSGRVNGFVKGLRIAERKGQYDYFWFVVNDVVFPEGQDVLRELVDVMEENPRMALIGPGEPGADDYFGCFPKEGRRWHKASTVHSLAFLMKREAIEKIGFLNPSFRYSQGAGTELAYKLYKNLLQVLRIVGITSFVLLIDEMERITLIPGMQKATFYDDLRHLIDDSPNGTSYFFAIAPHQWNELTKEPSALSRRLSENTFILDRFDERRTRELIARYIEFKRIEKNEAIIKSTENELFSGRHSYIFSNPAIEHTSKPNISTDSSLVKISEISPGYKRSISPDSASGHIPTPLPCERRTNI